MQSSLKQHMVMMTTAVIIPYHLSQCMNNVLLHLSYNVTICRSYKITFCGVIHTCTNVLVLYPFQQVIKYFFLFSVSIVDLLL